MKYICALIVSCSAIRFSDYQENTEGFDAMVELDVNTENSQSLWNSNFEEYHDSRPFEMDCDLKED